MFAVCCLLFGVCCLLFVVCCLLFVVCCLLLLKGGIYLKVSTGSSLFYLSQYHVGMPLPINTPRFAEVRW